MKDTTMKRMYIYPKDVERITGKKSSYCCNLIQLIRAIYGKKKHQCVTVAEYCDYMSVPREEVELYL